MKIVCWPAHLRLGRQAAGWTVRYAARRLGLELALLKSWERGIPCRETEYNRCIRFYSRAQRRQVGSVSSGTTGQVSGLSRVPAGDAFGVLPVLRGARDAARGESAAGVTDPSPAGGGARSPQ